MSDTYISDESVMLHTVIPEDHEVEGLEYGAHISRSSDGYCAYYVRPQGVERWGVARITPELSQVRLDSVIVERITEEILNAEMADEFETDE